MSTQQKQKNRPPEKFRLPLDKDGNVIIPKDKDGNPDYGAVMRYFRLFVKGWSARYLAIRYTEVLREQGEDEDEAITARWIQLMEKENQVPKDPKRRWILAMLLGIPAASFGLNELNQPPKGLMKTLHLILSGKPIDVGEYRTTLEKYCDTWQADKIDEMMLDIKCRISALQNEAFCTRSPEKQEMLSLWCEYHILAANIALSYHRFNEAIMLLNRAVIVAKDNKLYAVLSFGLRERGLVYLDRGEISAIMYGFETAKPDFDAAVNTFDEAIKLKKLVSAQRHALTVLLAGEAYANIAHSQKQLTTALDMIDEGGQVIRGDTEDSRILYASLDDERYHLDKAYAYIASPVRTLRFPQTAREKELDEATKRTQGFKTRHAENAFLQAKSYFVEGDYEMATTHTELSIPIVQNIINSRIHFVRLNAFYQGLLKSPFGQSDAVAELGVALLKAQKPHLFN